MKGGQTLHLRSGAADYHIFHRIFVDDQYRIDPIQASGKRLECVLDIGANVGIFATRVAPLAHQVLAFEAARENFGRLEQNVADWPQIQAFHTAVTASSGSIRLYVPSQERLSGEFSTYPGLSGQEARYEEVAALSLDDLFAAHITGACDLMKLDVEGAEYDIIEGASAATLSRVRRIVGEYHNLHDAQGSPRVEALQLLLEKSGFQVEIVSHRNNPNHGLFFAHRPQV